MTGEAIQSKTLLLAFIKRAKKLEDERAELAADVAEVCKEAKGEGFEPTKIREVVRWLRKIDKHGRDAVEAGEAIYDLYRQVAEPDGGAIEDLMSEARDKALLAMFAPAGDAALEEKLGARTKKMRDAMAMAAAAKQARQS